MGLLTTALFGAVSAASSALVAVRRGCLSMPNRATFHQAMISNSQTQLENKVANHMQEVRRRRQMEHASAGIRQHFMTHKYYGGYRQSQYRREPFRSAVSPTPQRRPVTYPLVGANGNRQSSHHVERNKTAVSPTPQRRPVTYPLVGAYRNKQSSHHVEQNKAAVSPTARRHAVKSPFAGTNENRQVEHNRESQKAAANLVPRRHAASQQLVATNGNEATKHNRESQKAAVNPRVKQQTSSNLLDETNDNRRSQHDLELHQANVRRRAAHQFLLLLSQLMSLNWFRGAFGRNYHSTNSQSSSKTGHEQKSDVNHAHPRDGGTIPKPNVWQRLVEGMTQKREQSERAERARETSALIPEKTSSAQKIEVNGFTAVKNQDFRATSQENSSRHANEQPASSGSSVNANGSKSEIALATSTSADGQTSTSTSASSAEFNAVASTTGEGAEGEDSGVEAE